MPAMPHSVCLFVVTILIQQMYHVMSQRKAQWEPPEGGAPPPVSHIKNGRSLSANNATMHPILPFLELKKKEENGGRET